MAKWQYFLNPIRWFSFIQGNIASWFLKMHIIEQVMYRSIICSECTNAGKCVECKCKTPELYMTTEISCSRQRWGPMMDKENWKKFKDIYNIKFKVENG